MECYKRALQVDVFCHEALDKLCKYHSLTANDAKQVLLSMPFKKQCSVVEAELVRALYNLQLSHISCSDSKPVVPLPVGIKSLATNTDVLSYIADKNLGIMKVDVCYTHTSRILENDPYHPHALLIHIVCCVTLSLTSELFTIGHRLVSTFPGSALAWYAVSCYYFTLRKHQISRKYLSKSISLDANFAPAHMTFGISLACEGERDQARSAFASAARIMQGSYLPLFFLGKEYYLTCAVSTSAKFIKNALSVSPNNPILLQEVGVMLFNIGDISKAESYLRSAALCVHSIDPRVTLPWWEPVYNNLGHVLRKLGKYNEALQMYQYSLQLLPNEPATLTSIAFTNLLNGNGENAIKYANHSLQFKREDQFTLELLNIAIEHTCADEISLSDGQCT